MEMRVEKAKLNLVGSKKVSVAVSETNIAKMNLAFNNPTQKTINHSKEVLKIIKETNFSDEYAKMEEIYKNGYLGFDESLNYLN